uniref:Calpain-1 catalytic subunit-like n=1 Tax=Echeneis naucrates TaxID=173247 RepID=A0A665TUX3_ECHNA
MTPPGVCMNIINARHKNDGYGTIANPENFLKQDFQQLKQYCLIRHVRYIDEMFPPDRNAIGSGLLSPTELYKVKWMRPSKLVANPSLVVDGFSRFDFGQGVVGDCWFLASIGALTFQDYIFEQVLPPGQSFNEDYCGLFHFRFWRFGRWLDVVIDDKLPTIDGRLIFVRSRDPNEFWPALLEKAYAKVCGSYADMNAGTPSEALVDFTGGVHMHLNLSDPPPNLWDLMIRAGNAKSLMGCGTPQGPTPENTVLPNGLVQGHAYTVTGVKEIVSSGQLVSLVRLWNPWGKGEWNGDWSDGSPLWHTVSKQERQVSLVVSHDGEFWLTLQDFCKFFSDLDICCLCPDFLDGNSTCHWTTSYYEGRWVAGTTAGGCMNNPGSFWTNPQYRVTIDKLLTQCSETQSDSNMLVSLMQKPDKRNRRLVQNLHIGFTPIPAHSGRGGGFPASFFNKNIPVAQTQTYVNAREVMELLRLQPGEYLIVPSTFNPNETASFILTILSKAETHHSPTENGADDENKRTFFRQYSDKYEEVDAEQLQMILNEKILLGDLKSGGFSIDACRSIIALLDTSITGRLNGNEFLRLWKKVVNYKEIFFRTDVSKTGTLSLSELRNAIMATGKRVSDDMLNLLALRYGASTGHITLESFISLCTSWMYLTMYT